MKITPLHLALLIVAASALAQSDEFDWGKPRRNVHEVSVAELLGRPDFFDGQPVRVIGVAQFSFEFEAGSSIYLTKEDAKHNTQTRIDILFGPEFSGPKSDIAALTGKYVAVEGVFQMLQRDPIRGQGDGLTVCFRQCPAAGYIEDINSVGLWW